MGKHGAKKPTFLVRHGGCRYAATVPRFIPSWNGGRTNVIHRSYPHWLSRGGAAGGRTAVARLLGEIAGRAAGSGRCRNPGAGRGRTVRAAAGRKRPNRGRSRRGAAAAGRGGIFRPPPAHGSPHSPREAWPWGRIFVVRRQTQRHPLAFHFCIALDLAHQNSSA